jgi:hypothetical protein
MNAAFRRAMELHRHRDRNPSARTGMSVTLENVLVVAAALPSLYGGLCWVRRGNNARRMANWVKENHAQAWRELHWLARLHDWAGVEVLIKKGLITGDEVKHFRERDERLERCTWSGLLISAALLLVLAVTEYVGSLFH